MGHPPLVIERPSGPYIISAPVPVNFSTLSRLPSLIFDLSNQNTSITSQSCSQMNEISVKRPVSTASTSSASMPRTPNSAGWERSEGYWSETGRPGPFVSEYDGSEGSGTPASLTCSSAAEIIEHPGSERWFDNDMVHKPSSSRIQSVTVQPIITVALPTPLPTPPSTNQPAAASIPTHSRSQSQSQVRLWPQPPPLTSSSSMSEQDWESSLSGFNPTANEPESDSDTKSDNTESASEDGGLKRRRHIRRAGRAPPRLPRPLPPLPASMNILTHSQSTAGRFMTAPIENLPISTPNPRDSLHRAHTTNWTTVKTPTSARLPPAKSHTPKTSAGKIPNLRLSTLGLRSSASDANAVLVKTPNRKFNAPFSVAPPMPTDAANTIDWELLDDALEIDSDLDMDLHLHDSDDATPLAIPGVCDRMLPETPQ
jgi:hypothetical protein